MTISAKFPSKCSECGGRVFKGDEIEWTRGVKGVRHTNCGEHQPEPEEGNDNLDMERGPGAQNPATIARAVEEGKDGKPYRLAFAFEFSKMTVEQLKAFKLIVEAELEKRETTPVVEPEVKA